VPPGLALPLWSLAQSISPVAGSPPRIRSARVLATSRSASRRRRGAPPHPGRARAGRAAWRVGPAATRRAPRALPLLGWPSQQAGTPGVRRLVLHDFPSIASCLVKRFYPVHLQDFRSIRPAPVSALRSTKQRVPSYFRVFPCRHDADLRSASASRAMLPHSFRVLGRCASCEPVLLATGLP
jgi:hypothetical protein